MTGFLAADKGENITSFFAVNKIRRIAGEKKCGHTGTLDPMATGVLVVALGGATRFIELLPDHTKKYRASFRTGLRSDTLDIWGNITERSQSSVSIDDINKLLPMFRGRIMQLPPMYSALKKDGVRLYDLARKGIEVEREKRECEIFSLEAEASPDGDFILECECSSGTYIRSLISDIGDELGCGAVMTSLRRTFACGVDISDCITLDGLRQAAESSDISGLLIPVEKMFEPYPRIDVTVNQGVRFKNGGALSRDRINCGGISGFRRVYSENVFLGLGEISDDSEELAVKRVFVDR